MGGVFGVPNTEIRSETSFSSGLETKGRAGAFSGSVASSPPVLSRSANDVLFGTYAEKLLEAPLNALNALTAGPFVGAVVGGAIGTNADLTAPKADVEPNVGAAATLVGVFGELPKAKIEVVGGVSVGFLKNGELVLGPPKLPNAPNPLAGLNAEGVV